MYDLYERAVFAQQRLDQELLDIFNEVEKRAPELVAKMVEVLGGRGGSAH